MLDFLKSEVVDYFLTFHNFNLIVAPLLIHIDGPCYFQAAS